jgi:hypothetical protein
MNSELRAQASTTIDSMIAAVRAQGVPVAENSVKFLKDNPAFLSMPALRVACRAPSFVKIFEPENNAGGFDIDPDFHQKLVEEMMSLGDDKIPADVHVSHAASVARAIVRKSVSTDQQYALMDGYNEVPSSVKVANDINFPAHRSV